MKNWKYFSDDEIAKWQLDPQMWSMLDMARDKAGIPFIITSGRRTLEQETALKGGVRDSSHISGWGVDLHVENKSALAHMLIGLGSAGFKRFGIYRDAKNNPTHIHVDADPDLLVKTGPVVWMELEQNC